MVGDTLSDVGLKPLLRDDGGIVGRSAGALLPELPALLGLAVGAAATGSSLLGSLFLGVAVSGDVLLESSVLVEVLNGTGSGRPLARGGAVVVGGAVLEVLVAEGHTRGVGFRHVADAALADRGRWVKEWGSVDWVSTCVNGRKNLRWGWMGSFEGRLTSVRLYFGRGRICR